MKIKHSTYRDLVREYGDLSRLFGDDLSLSDLVAPVLSMVKPTKRDVVGYWSRAKDIIRSAFPSLKIGSYSAGIVDTPSEATSSSAVLLAIELSANALNDVLPREFANLVHEFLGYGNARMRNFSEPMYVLRSKNGVFMYVSDDTMHAYSHILPFQKIRDGVLVGFGDILPKSGFDVQPRPVKEMFVEHWIYPLLPCQNSSSVGVCFPPISSSSLHDVYLRHRDYIKEYLMIVSALPLSSDDREREFGDIQRFLKSEGMSVGLAASLYSSMFFDYGIGSSLDAAITAESWANYPTCVSCFNESKDLRWVMGISELRHIRNRSIDVPFVVNNVPITLEAFAQENRDHGMLDSNRRYTLNPDTIWLDRAGNVNFALGASIYDLLDMASDIVRTKMSYDVVRELAEDYRQSLKRIRKGIYSEASHGNCDSAANLNFKFSSLVSILYDSIGIGATTSTSPSNSIEVPQWRVVMNAIYLVFASAYLNDKFRKTSLLGGLTPYEAIYNAVVSRIDDVDVFIKNMVQGDMAYYVAVEDGVSGFMGRVAAALVVYLSFVGDVPYFRPAFELVSRVIDLFDARNVKPDVLVSTINDMGVELNELVDSLSRAIGESVAFVGCGLEPNDDMAVDFRRVDSWYLVQTWRVYNDTHTVYDLIDKTGMKQDIKISFHGRVSQIVYVLEALERLSDPSFARQRILDIVMSNLQSGIIARTWTDYSETDFARIEGLLPGTIAADVDGLLNALNYLSVSIVSEIANASSDIGVVISRETAVALEDRLADLLDHSMEEAYKLVNAVEELFNRLGLTATDHASWSYVTSVSQLMTIVNSSPIIGIDDYSMIGDPDVDSYNVFEEFIYQEKPELEIEFRFISKGKSRTISALVAKMAILSVISEIVFGDIPDGIARQIVNDSVALIEQNLSAGIDIDLFDASKIHSYPFYPTNLHRVPVEMYSAMLDSNVTIERQKLSKPMQRLLTELSQEVRRWQWIPKSRSELEGIYQEVWRAVWTVASDFYRLFSDTVNANGGPERYVRRVKRLYKNLLDNAAFDLTHQTTMSVGELNEFLDMSGSAALYSDIWVLVMHRKRVAKVVFNVLRYLSILTPDPKMKNRFRDLSERWIDFLLREGFYVINRNWRVERVTSRNDIFREMSHVDTSTPSGLLSLYAYVNMDSVSLGGVRSEVGLEMRSSYAHELFYAPSAIVQALLDTLHGSDELSVHLAIPYSRFADGSISDIDVIISRESSKEFTPNLKDFSSITNLILKLDPSEGEFLPSIMLAKLGAALHSLRSSGYSDVDAIFTDRSLTGYAIHMMRMKHKDAIFFGAQRKAAFDFERALENDSIPRRRHGLHILPTNMQTLLRLISMRSEGVIEGVFEQELRMCNLGQATMFAEILQTLDTYRYPVETVPADRHDVFFGNELIVSPNFQEMLEFAADSEAVAVSNAFSVLIPSQVVQSTFEQGAHTLYYYRRDVLASDTHEGQRLLMSASARAVHGQFAYITGIKSEDRTATTLIRHGAREITKSIEPEGPITAKTGRRLLEFDDPEPADIKHVKIPVQKRLLEFDDPQVVVYHSLPVQPRPLEFDDPEVTTHTSLPVPKRPLEFDDPDPGTTTYVKRPVPKRPLEFDDPEVLEIVKREVQKRLIEFEPLTPDQLRERREEITRMIEANERARARIAEILERSARRVREADLRRKATKPERIRFHIDIPDDVDRESFFNERREEIERTLRIQQAREHAARLALEEASRKARTQRDTKKPKKPSRFQLLEFDGLGDIDLYEGDASLDMWQQTMRLLGISARGKGK